VPASFEIVFGYQSVIKSISDMYGQLRARDKLLDGRNTLFEVNLTHLKPI